MSHRHRDLPDFCEVPDEERQMPMWLAILEALVLVLVIWLALVLTLSAAR